MKTIVVISNNYPSKKHPYRGVFVYNIIKEFSKYYKVVVIVPTAWNFGSTSTLQKLDEDPSEVVLYPYYTSFSRLIYHIPLLNALTEYSIRIAVEKGLQNIKDIYFIYAHFLASAVPALKWAGKHNIPVFTALGESSIYPRYQYIINNSERLKKIKHRLRGVIAVSDILQSFANDHLGISNENILLSPNATDPAIFYPSKSERNILGFPENQFIVSFIGAFIERKGIDVILSAAKSLPDVGFVLMGKGVIAEKPANILMCEKVHHDRIPQILNASDAFVFPTKAEGSSNAIAEAMACGLPIITSDIPEVVFQVGKDNALFINPDSSEQLIVAIEFLKSNQEERIKLSKKSIEVSQNRTVQSRAENILKWIEQKIE